MRQVYIDLTTEHAHVSNENFIGYMGEHNATELLITIPQVMVNSSDYQVVVFQSGPLVFRTKHITTDASEATYREGNTIHTKLSKSLTAVSQLSLQVECYKENEKGENILVGKTQTVGHLILKPSPEGLPAFNYDGSFEDIEAAIEKAHKHDNLDVLSLFSVDEKGDVLFNGEHIEGVKKYPNPSSLPTDAAIGTLAVALEDDEQPEPEPLEFKKKLSYLKFKDNINVEDFSEITEIDPSYESGPCQIQFNLKDKNNDTVAQIIFVHAPEFDASFMALYDQYSHKLMRFAYLREALDVVDNAIFAFYNPYKEFDFNNISAEEGGPYMTPLGYSVYSIRAKDPYVDSNLNRYDSRYIDFNTEEKNYSSYFVPYSDVTLEIDSEYNYDEEKSLAVLSKAFETVPEKALQKGLYVFTEDGWKSLNDDVERQFLLVNGFPELPLDAKEGTLAYVLHDACAFSRQDFSIGRNTYYGDMYFHPFYNDFALMYDFTLVVDIYRNNGSGYVKYADAFTVTTNKDSKYFVADVKPSNSYNTRHLIYSWEDQTIEYSENIQLEVKEGWNEVFPDETPVKVISGLTYSDLPRLKATDATSNCFFKLTSIETPGYSEKQYYPMYQVGAYPNASFDNGKGIWVKTRGEWEKHVDNGDYIFD